MIFDKILTAPIPRGTSVRLDTFVSHDVSLNCYDCSRTAAGALFVQHEELRQGEL